MENALDVLNPGGKDPTQDFSAGPSRLEEKGHPPINYHAYAACMLGRFACRVSDLRANAVLLLLRGNLVDSLRAAKTLSVKKIPFFISWKEAGRHQVAHAISHPRILMRFMEISGLALGFLASTSWLPPIHRAAGLSDGKFIPTPYPIDFSQWDFRISPEERSGIFIGTREFLIPSRNHAAAVFASCDLAYRLRSHVTCINTEGRRGEKLLNHIDAGRGVLRIVEGCLPYKDYLKLLARHRMVLQFDRSGVPGQIAGDAALCGIPAIGGDGSVDDLLNHTLSQLKRCDFETSLEQAHQLLTNFSLYVKITEVLRRRALEVLSFQEGTRAIFSLITRRKSRNF